MILSAKELDIGESPPKEVSLPGSHPLAEEINRIAAEQLKYAQAGVHDHVWELFTEEGEMKMYKRELQIDGIICDPLKAVHCVEVCELLEICSDLKFPGQILKDKVENDEKNNWPTHGLLVRRCVFCIVLRSFCRYRYWFFRQMLLDKQIKTGRLNWQETPP
ncbi:unnamed protein product [Gongylonema pulchrum]|uniref:Ubiquitin-like-conjugating enzyme ATG3 n=1 Tax=Gongylonema pulchrum TaxID=637853 RepID=A0A183EW46_9BILA|nr:unnamed protein product [Gongylonema pulchrum]